VFLAMELLRGEALDRRIKRLGGMDWRDAIETGIEVCDALEAAHAAGLVHRDLKPANLFVTETGGLKLLDFGVAMALADVVSDAREKRQKGFAIFGTPEYMAPEQVAGEAVDGRCDLYSLGCVLYELVTGTRVFEGTSSVVIMGKQMREMPDAPRLRAPTRAIPEEVDLVILRALAKSPGERFATAAEFREALEDVLRVPARRRARARKVAFSVMTGAMLLVAAAGSAHWMSKGGGQAMARVAMPLVRPLAELAPVAMNETVAEPWESIEDVAPIPVESEPVPVSMPVAASQPEAEPLHIAVHDGKPDKARALVEARAAARETHSVRTLRAWTMAALDAGRSREARRAAETWALHDDTPEPRIVLAKVLDAGGHRPDAMAVLEEVLQTHPESNEARRLHAKLGPPLPPADTEAHRTQVARR
jgi:hypothetical protein